MVSGEAYKVCCTVTCDLRWCMVPESEETDVRQYDFGYSF